MPENDRRAIQACVKLQIHGKQMNQTEPIQKDAKPQQMRRRLISAASVLALIVIAVLIYTPNYGLIASLQGSAVIKKTNRQTETVTAKSRLREKESLKTEKSARLAILFPNMGIVKIMPETEIKIEKLNSGEVELMLLGGKALIKVSKLPAKKSFIVRTPASVIVAHGAEFSISYDQNNSTVAAAEGKLLVTSNKQEIFVESGKAADLKEKIVLRQIHKKEALDLERLHTLEIPATAGNPAEFEKATGAIDNSADHKIADFEKKYEAKKNLLSLDEIRTKYKHLHKLTLKNGKIMYGAVVSRGEKYHFITAAGTIAVPKSEISNIEPIR
jgi:hypothetical protein